VTGWKFSLDSTCPAWNCHVDHMPLNFEPSQDGLPCLRLETFVQSLLSMNDMVVLTELVYRMNLWQSGKENLDLSGTVDIAGFKSRMKLFELL
jgi:hypothetical protein